MDNQFSFEAQQVISHAEAIAFKFSHNLVGSEHLLLGFLNYDNPLSKELKKYKVTYDQIYKKIKELYTSLEDSMYLEYTFELKNIVAKAKYFANYYRERLVSVNSLALALLHYDDATYVDILKKYKINYKEINNFIIGQLKKSSELLQISDLHPLDQVKKDPLIGRKDELKQLIMALSRRNKPNAILVGEPGVGKTAIVEELALLLRNEEVPSLKGKSIYELDLVSAIGGTKYRGEFEEKIKKILKKVIEDGNAILFIDEIHNIIKAGGAEGAIDAANILKPYLSRGEIQLIGATTEDEYQNIFEKDKALKRRFQIIKIKPSSKEETFEILKTNKHLYEQYYHLSIDDEVLKHIITIADNHLSSYYFPDKAIDILDNSCVSAKDKLTVEDINLTVESLYKVKINMLEKSSSVICDISSSIYGIDTVLAKLKRNLKLVDNGIYEKNKPILSMMFLGPPGVGKTSVANIIGKTYFGEDNIIYLNMACYQDAFSLSKLISHSNDGVSSFVKSLKAMPKSLIIIDEVEKANNDILDLFLNILDQGFFESSKGEKINCKSTMIIMISNYGYDNHYMFKKNITKELNDNYIIKNLQNRFRYEFLSRLDDIVVFPFIERDYRYEIAKNYFEFLGEDPKLHDVEKVLIHNDEEYDKFGVRLIQKDVKNAIVNNLLEKQK